MEILGYVYGIDEIFRGYDWGWRSSFILDEDNLFEFMGRKIGKWLVGNASMPPIAYLEFHGTVLGW